jgi:hypothetical protein
MHKLLHFVLYHSRNQLCLLVATDNVIIPIPSVDRGPADERNIKGIVMNVSEHGGYKIGTKVGQIKGYMSLLVAT